MISDENSHHRDRLESMKIIAHQMSHQFFGNVVTIKPRDQNWLNKGFATLFEHLLVDNVYPELRMQHYFNVETLQTALKVDAIETSHPMTYDGESITEITNAKGEPIVRLIFLDISI